MKFFTFPLCVLAMPLANEKQILMHMVSHSLERAGGGDGAEEIDSNESANMSLNMKTSVTAKGAT